ncbi:MAG: 4Fe-4S binding protein [Muribaculaceae bacterium]|nr:4Fe-4S binding protein [Muribaculaceae bacterium]
MEYKAVNLIYFSACGTTEKIINTVASNILIDTKKRFSLLNLDVTNDILLPSDEIAIFAIPVYSGRVPQVVGNKIKHFKGSHTPAIIITVYGNRDFDDALIELNDIVSANNFYVISAAAFIARHSIFPIVGNGRPNDNDISIIKDFAKNSYNFLLNPNFYSTTVPLNINGNHKYREIKKIPLNPKTSNRCNLCNLCVNQCPVQAIDANNPKKINKKLCISCAHCISICPMKAKRFGGLLYQIAQHKFAKKYSSPQQAYIVYRK